MIPVYDVTSFTMLDYPDVTACILWFAGCNMRCGYCHNPDIIRAKGNFDEEQILKFLTKRQNKLEGVVLSGGECTGYPNLKDFIKRIKALGYLVKMDTNGTKPKLIKELIEEGLIDYLALDFKATEDKFFEITKCRKIPQFKESLAVLCAQNKIPFEVRTTVHTDLLNEQDIKEIMDDLEAHDYKGIYYVQNYRHGDNEGRLQEQTKPLDITSFRDYKFNVEYRNF